MSILEVKNLKKVYRDIVAVEDVSFAVSEGHCLGLLGPNGAGKTTTMEIIENIITPTSGTIYYKGTERSRSFREEIGIQFQHTSLLNFLSVAETIECYRQLYRKSVETEWLIDRCDLSTILTRKNNQLSGGQRQRLMLALALLNEPDLLFLDEPSTGLDPQSKRYLWDIVEEVKKEGKTIILTTHSMAEAEFLCDSIAIMDQGLIIANGSPAQLITDHCNTNTITLSPESVAKQLSCLEMDYKTNGSSVLIKTTHVDDTLGKLISCGVDLSEMTVYSANLEDVFLHLTGRTLRD
ncbi:MAG: ABC transporter ATP-binding protein [Desulfobacterales bacterium]|nr:ABC transporter ATP-binding protein [Desulfobacterales bacterium]